MEPLSSRKRKMYFTVCVLLFVLLCPVVILYSIGYRFDKTLGFVKTGGLYINLDLPGAEIYLDSKLVRHTNVLFDSYFLQNLRPKEYFIIVAKEGYYSWAKRLPIMPEKVTQIEPFLLPKETPLREIPMQNQEYSQILAFFLKENASELLQSEDLIRERVRVKDGEHFLLEGKVAIWQKDNTVYAGWASTLTTIPYFFCTNEECSGNVKVFTSPSKLVHADFFPGKNNLVIIAYADGILVSEIDIRHTQNTEPLYMIPGADFRVIDDVVYVKDGEKLFEVEL